MPGGCISIDTRNDYTPWVPQWHGETRRRWQLIRLLTFADRQPISCN